MIFGASKNPLEQAERVQNRLRVLHERHIADFQAGWQAGIEQLASTPIDTLVEIIEGETLNAINVRPDSFHLGFVAFLNFAGNLAAVAPAFVSYFEADEAVGEGSDDEEEPHEHHHHEAETTLVKDVEFDEGYIAEREAAARD